MDPLVNDHIDVKGKRKDSALNTFFIITVLFGVCLYFLVTFFLNYFNIIHLSNISPVFSFLPHEPNQSENIFNLLYINLSSKDIPKQQLETCVTREKDYSLVYDVSRNGPITVGEYRGTIISLSPNGSNVTIAILSGDSKERHTFDVSSTLPLYDAIHATQIHWKDLHIGDYIGITFNCIQDKGEQFTITTIGIEQKQL